MNQEPVQPSASTVVERTARNERRREIRNVVSSVLILLMAPLLAIVLTLFVFQSYQVDGPSMETTLHNGDRLIVWKLPRTIARMSGHAYVPNRGDVIIFSEPGLGNFENPDGSKQLVKRVIGLPGERVLIKEGRVMVFNKEHPEGFVPDETLQYGKEITIPASNHDGDYNLEDDQIFVCGDNRPNSLDSRSFGPIHTDQLIGKLVLRIFPLNNTKLF